MRNRMPGVGIIGVGMVGEPLRRWFEESHGYRRGRDLFCYDIDPKKGYFDDPNRADVIFVAVPTPANPDGSCNTSPVEQAVASVKDGKIIVIKSTVPPGTTERLQKRHPGKRVLFNPEFLTESQAWSDFIKPDRQLVAHTAVSHQDAQEVLALLPPAHFVRPWSSDYVKKRITVTEAELAKYASNVFGYLKVVFANIVADVSHALRLALAKEKIPSEVSYENVRAMIAADPRIGPAWLDVERGSYCGVGGRCFPKDMDAFIKMTEALIRSLERPRAKDAGSLKALKKGVALLTAVRDYNEALLAWQGLKPQDVSKHNHEIVTGKRKPIRV